MREVLLGARKTRVGNLTMGGGEQGQQGHEEGEEAGHCCWECVLKVEKDEAELDVGGKRRAGALEGHLGQVPRELKLLSSPRLSTPANFCAVRNLTALITILMPPAP